MALIKSTRTGYWSSGSTWEGGQVPDPNTDDVEILSGHRVTTDDMDYVVVKSGRYVTVKKGGTLEIDYWGEIDLYGGGQINIEGGTFEITYGYFWFGGDLNIRDGGKVYLWDFMEMYSGACITFDRREGGFYSWWNKMGIDFTKAYGFDAPGV